jgi:hypothetical protein
MPIIKTLEPHPKLVSIRKAYFTREFWKGWKQLDNENKEIYLLGWLAKMEHDLALLAKQFKETSGEARNEADRHRHHG